MARRTIGWRVRYEERYVGDTPRSRADTEWRFIRDELRKKRDAAVTDLRWFRNYKRKQVDGRSYRIRNIRLVRVTRPVKRSTK